MEGEGERLPREEGAKKPMTKIIVAVVVIIVIIAAIGAALLLMGGQEPANKSPTATATADGTVVKSGSAVAFSAAGSTDPDGEIANYTWNFGDGTAPVDMGNVTTATHQYAYPGIYLIALTVKDNDGATNTNWQNLVRIQVLNPDPPASPGNDTLPYAVAAASGSVIEDGTEVEFDANSSAAYSYIYNAAKVRWDLASGIDYVANVTWNFGDGSAVVKGAIDSEGGNYSASYASHTYNGDGVIYASYVTIESMHSSAPTQRYYNSIAVLPAAAPTPGGVKNPDTFVMATIGEPDTLDPAIDYESAGNEVLQNVYETLIWYDGEHADQLKAVLATQVPTRENGGISANFLNYTFTLRQGVKFHDGTDMTSEDVEYSIERALTMNDAYGPVWMLSQVMLPTWPGPGKVCDPTEIDDSVTTNGDFEVTIHLYKPYPAMIQVLAYTLASVVSKDFVEAHGGVSAPPDDVNEYMIDHTCGTGPFELVEWSRGQYVLMQKFDNYWSSQKAALKYVIIKQVNDFGTRLMMLLAGDADCIYVPRQHMQDVMGHEDILDIVSGKPTFTVDFIGMNQNVTASDIDNGNVPADFFADVHVRRAFNYAFNFDKYLTEIMKNTGIQPNSVIPEGMFGWNASVPMYTFNLTKAAQELSLAINPDTGNSWLEDGFELILYYNAGNTVREGAAQMFATDLQSLAPGKIVVTVNAMAWPTYLSNMYGGTIACFFVGWMPDFVDADDYAYPFLHKYGTYPLLSLRFENDTLSAMIEEAAMETDLEQRALLYYEISMSNYENAYYVLTTQATNFHVERDWVNGYYFNPAHAGLYYYPLSKA